MTARRRSEIQGASSRRQLALARSDGSRPFSHAVGRRPLRGGDSRRDQPAARRRIELEQQLAPGTTARQSLARVLSTAAPTRSMSASRHALKATGELAGADRCWLISMVGKGDSEPEHFDWCTDGVAAAPHADGPARPKPATLGLAAARQRRTRDVPPNRRASRTKSRAVRDSLVEERGPVVPRRSDPIRRDADRCVGIPLVAKREGMVGPRESSLFQLVAGMFTSALRRKRAEAHLRESEERFRALAEHAKDPICEVDRNSGEILYASPSFTDLLGYDRDEISDAEPLFAHSTPPTSERCGRRTATGGLPR